MRSGRVSRTNTADAPYVRRMWPLFAKVYSLLRIRNDLRRKSGQKTPLAGGTQRARARAPFDSRGGKAKPFTYSQNAPPAYECGLCGFRLRAPLFDSRLVSSLRRRQRTPASSPSSSRVTRVRASAERHARLSGSPSAVYPQSIKTACQP